MSHTMNQIELSYNDVKKLVDRTEQDMIEKVKAFKQE